MKIDITDEKNPRVIGEGTLGRDHQDHGQVTPMGNLIFIGNDHGTGSAFFCHQTGKDVIPPTIVKVYPADGATFQPVTSRITIAMSDYIDMRSVSSSTIAIRPAGGSPLSGIYNYVFNTLSFGPDQPLSANTTYEIVIRAGGIKDVMGNAIASERIVRFSTGGTIVTPMPDGGTDGPSDASGAGARRVVRVVRAAPQPEAGAATRATRASRGTRARAAAPATRAPRAARAPRAPRESQAMWAPRAGAAPRAPPAWGAPEWRAARSPAGVAAAG